MVSLGFDSPVFHSRFIDIALLLGWQKKVLKMWELATLSINQQVNIKYNLLWSPYSMVKWRRRFIYNNISLEMPTCMYTDLQRVTKQTYK